MASIRLARPGDATAIGELHVHSWKTAYRGIISDAYLDGTGTEERIERWRSVLREARGDEPVFVAEDDGKVVGFSSGGPPRNIDDPDAMELFALYVDPSHYRRGIGDALLRAFLNFASSRVGAARAASGVTASDRVVLRVARDNANARTFYERRGFSWDGTTTEADIRGARVAVCRYERTAMGERRLREVVVAASNGASDLDGILSLQQENLPANLPQGNKQPDGFVTVVHTRAILERMHREAPSVVARAGSEVVAYALTMPLECRSFLPILEPMFALFEKIEHRGAPLSQSRFYVMGQICVAARFRGAGLFSALYAHHLSTFEKRYDLVVTEVSQHNARSLRAHERVGFETLARYRDATDEWAVIGFDFRRSAR